MHSFVSSGRTTSKKKKIASRLSLAAAAVVPFFLLAGSKIRPSDLLSSLHKSIST
jgi:hypothetical protein